MKKFNRHFSQALLLGVTATVVGSVLPAQAQTPSEILDACTLKDPALLFGQKCDPNADKVKDATDLPSNQPGLVGSFNVVPTPASGDPLVGEGLAFEGTGETYANGVPKFNIDFAVPSQVKQVSPGSEEVVINPGADPNNVGQFRVLSSDLDFENLLDWKGNIKDLTFGTGAFGGAAFPTASTRVQNFMVINQPGVGNGQIDGEATGGVALDLLSIEDPSLQADANGTSLSFDLVLQAYKLDAQGHRLEEQEKVPDGFNIYANTVTARLSAAIAGFTPAEVIAQIDEEGELFAWYGYDITFNSTTDSVFIPSGDEIIPEPTTIISSLLLMSGGAFKLSKRKKGA